MNYALSNDDLITNDALVITKLFPCQKICKPDPVPDLFSFMVFDKPLGSGTLVCMTIIKIHLCACEGRA